MNNGGLIKPKFGLMSVSDKTGLVELGRGFSKRGIEIISTGGTFGALDDAGVQVQEVAAYSGQPEILDGRVKTLTPHIHGGLLADLDIAEHIREIGEQSIRKIDILVANLYAFQENYAKFQRDEITRTDLIDKIDIGGPAMLRSAAKNFKHTTVVTDPDDYNELFSNLDENDGHTSLDFREHLAAKVFALTTAYDAVISDFFEGEK